MRKQVGAYLRKKHPYIYAKYQKIISIAPSFYVLDHLGGSFKDYIFKENMSDRVKALKRNLDEYSVHTVDTLIQRILNYPEAQYKVRMKVKADDVIGGLLEEETLENRKNVNKYLDTIHKKYVIPRVFMEASIFYYHHGLALFPSEVQNYVKGGDFIDLGAYIGDSALALYQYGYKKIYSIEMSQKSMEQYGLLMQKNNIAPSKYELIHAAIASNDNLPPIHVLDSGTSDMSVIESGEGNIKVFQKSLDTIVKEKQIIPKFIKADIEGYSLELVKGAVNTIKKYRPVMCISIYHNPYEFFEVKPFLEDNIDNYKYIIRKLTVSPFVAGCHGEATLMAYPEEILE
jgi:FkbM family methyltransferase